MIADEKETVEIMIRMYCHYKEGNRRICTCCEDLLTYAHARLDRCRFGDAKGSCRRCPTHCYAPAMASRMREVMRWSGPRMLLLHPILAIRHLVKEKISR